MMLGGTAVVGVVGEIDFRARAAFLSVFREAPVRGARCLVVSLRDCTYIDAACVSVLFMMQREWSQIHVVAVAGSLPLRLIQVAAPGKGFMMCDSVDDALANCLRQAS